MSRELNENGLTAKQEAFCEFRAQYPRAQGYEAYKQAFEFEGKDTSAASHASKLMGKPIIVARINQLRQGWLSLAPVTPEEIMSAAAEIARNSSSETHQLNAWKFLADILHLKDDGIKINNTINTDPVQICFDNED